MIIDTEKLPELYSADVVVCGAGPGGIGAACMAAAAGAEVVVIEYADRPGGMASVGEVNPFMVSAIGGEMMDFPVYDRWVKAIYKYYNRSSQQKIDEAAGTAYARRTFTAAQAALGAEDLLKSAGVKVFYQHTLTAVNMDGDKIASVVVHSKSGFSLVRGKMFVDCTGDADLAALAGCAFEKGDETGGCQPMSVCFKLGNVHLPEGVENVRDLKFEQEYFIKKHSEACAKGEISCCRENLLTFPMIDPHTVHFNTTRVIEHDATDGASRSEAGEIGREQMREYLFWLRKNVPGFEEAELVSFGGIGVRESRRVKGMYYLQADELAGGKCFDDGIARCNYPVDIHNPHGKGTILRHLKPGEFYEVPYGCIVPQTVDNLTIGGRPISADVAVHSSLRIMPTACSIGQGAGIAAAMAIQKNCIPRQLDGREVRAALVKMGANL